MTKSLGPRPGIIGAAGARLSIRSSRRGALTCKAGRVVTFQQGPPHIDVQDQLFPLPSWRRGRPSATTKGNDPLSLLYNLILGYW
jgi:hypothetical protein